MLALAFAYAPAWAERDLYSGNYWLELCKEGGRSDGVCIGYINGLRDMHDMMLIMGKEPMWCAPQNVTMGQMQRVIVTEVSKRPETHHQLFILLAAAALKTSFPCKK